MANKKFNLTFDASLDITKVKTALNNIQNGMAGIELPKNIGSNLEKTFVKINSEIAKFEQQAERGISSTLDLSNLTKSGRKILDLYQDLQVSMRQLSNLGDKELEKLFPPEITNNIEKARNAFKQYENEIVKNEKAITAQRTELEKSGKTIEKIKNSMASTSGKKLVTNEELDNLKKQAKSASDEVGQLQGELDKLREAKIEKEGTLAQPNKSSSYRSLLTEIAEVENKLTIARQKSIDLNNQLGNTTTHQKQQTELNKLSIQLEEAENSFKQTEEAIESIQGAGNNQALVSLFETLKQIPGIDLSQFETSAEGAAQAINYLVQQGLLNARNNVINFANSLDNANPEIEEFKHNVNSGERALTDFISREQELEDFGRKLLNFFSIDNAVQLFKRALSSAYESVKELDEVMTQTAVVTDFTVGDMWSQLPEYTQRANELGVSVKGAYEAATLYYQQGLATNEVVAVSAETLKMARIAGMDYAQATDYMTAALRGFNMEINEGSAHRVNNVYSELAAITASDTQEIATAMTKTASIANNANMEFETTAAFLSQIIETTRESAETAGTAMKTVIARFQELKKDPSLIGEVDGEMVDANKIETALRTIGVSLRDTNGQFRDLDDVFLEIASKWDSLDTNTQRYIATMAAGSRQQSRFIAMMSNYDRTMELVTAANNSAGASQEQFEKTLESLESKLAKLQNAWNEFTMGITNSTVIKTGIDILTALLEVINNLTGAFGDTGSAFTKLLLGFGAIKGGKALLGGSFSNILKGVLTGNFEDIGKQVGDKAGQGILSSLKNKFKQTKILTGQEGSNIVKGFISKFDELSTLNFDKPLSEALSQVSTDNLDVAGLKENLFKAIQNASIREEDKEALFDLGKDITSPEAFKDFANIVEEAGVSSQKVSKQMVTDWKAVGGAIAGAGLAVSAIGQALKKAGFEEAGELLTKVGTAATILGTIFSVALPLAAAKGGAAMTAALGPIAILISAVVGLGIALEHFIKTSKEKLEELNNRVKETQEAAKQAKDTYDALLSEKAGYQETQENLNNLVEGTLEWRDALFEANQQVLELLNNYKGLRVVVGEKGELTIDPQSWKEAEDKVRQQVINTQISASGAEMSLASFKAGEAYNAVKGSFTKKLPEDSLLNIFSKGKATGQEYIDFYDKNVGIIEQYINNIDSLEEKDISLIEENLPKNQIEAIVEDIKNYKEIAKEANDEIKQSLSSTLSLSLSDEFNNIENLQDIISTFSDERSLDFFDKVNSKAENLTGTVFELADKYKELTGLEADTNWSASELKSRIAEFETIEEYTTSLENIVDDIQKIENPDIKNTLFGYFSGGATLRKDDITTVDTSNPIINELAENLGMNVATLVKNINNIIADNATAFEAIKESQRKFADGQVDEADTILGNATRAQYEGYMNQLSAIAIKAMAEGGVKGAQRAAEEFNTTFKSILTDYSSQREKILDIAATSDFTTTSGIEAFYEALEAIGVHIPFEQQKDFISQLKTLGATVNDIDLSTLINQVKSLRDLADSLRDRELSEGITQDEYDQIKETGAVNMTDFYWTGQEYIYLGDSMATLAEALDNNSIALAENRVEEIKGQIASGENFQTAIDSLPETWTTENIEAFETGTLEDTDLIREALGYTGRKGERYTDEEVLAKYQQGYSNYTQLPELQGQVDTYGTQARQIALLDTQNLSDFNRTAITGKYTTQEQEDALQGKINSEGLQSEVEHVTNSLQEQNSALSKNKQLITFLASANKKAQQSFKTLNTAISENADVLKNGEKNTQAYNTALYNIAKSAQEIFGDKVDTSFVETYKEQFLALIEGGEAADEAFKTLSEKIALKYVESVVGAQAATDTFQQALNILATTDLPDLEMGATCDASQAFTTLTELMGSAEHAAALLGSLGYTVEYEPTGLYRVENSDGTTDIVGVASAGAVEIYKAVVTKTDYTGAGGYTPSSGGGGGGGSSKPPENPYDKLHNIIEEQNENLRERNRLETEFATLQANGDASLQDHVNYHKSIIESLEKEIELEEKLLAGRREELQDLINQNPEVLKYGSYSEETGLFTIDYEAIEELRTSNEEEFEKIIDILKEVEEKSSSIEESNDKILDAQKEIALKRQQALEGYVAFEERVATALQTLVEREIETLEKEFSALTNAENALFDAINTSINEARQARENERIEDDIAEKERRLAYLRQDTSGSNALVIKRLEEELKQQKEGYQDSLIDQHLNAIQEQNQTAQEQRERQIELMQSQLDWDIEHNSFYKEAEALIREAAADGFLTKDDRLYQYLSDAENWSFQTAAQWDLINTKLHEEFALALEYLRRIAGEKDIKLVDDFENSPDLMRMIIDEYLANGRQASDTMAELLNARTERILKYGIEGVDTFNNSVDELIQALGEYTEAQLRDPSFTIGVGSNYHHPIFPNQTGSSGSGKYFVSPSDYGDAQAYWEHVYATTDANARAWVNGAGWVPIEIDPTTNKTITTGLPVGTIIDTAGGEFEIISVNPDGSYNGVPAENVDDLLKKYATGGLADFTGPAWLDGTKSRPELVLNAQDTQNFLALRDILSSFLRNLPNREEKGGDNYFDIDIQVDKIENDYDVDQMAERIKQNIYTDSMYRNVNAINLLR